MYSGSAPPQQGAHGEARAGLAEKLQARHQAALRSFKQTIAALNEEIDAEQLRCLENLKVDLAHSHAESEALLAEETARVEEHERFLDTYAQRLAGDAHTKDGTTPVAPIPDGAVLPPYEDVFHALHPEGEAVDAAAAAETRDAMQAERLRLLDRAVLLRRLYSARADAVMAVRERMEAMEVDRREAIQQSLRDLMLALAKVSYCSVTASHALAQRVLHGVNEQVAINFAGVHTLLTQLGKREVLKQRVYAQAIAGLIARTHRRMQRSAVMAARTLLQSAPFRRPADRMTIVEQVCAVSSRARRDGMSLLTSLAAMLRSLRDTGGSGQGRPTDRSAAAAAATALLAATVGKDSTLVVPPSIACGGVGSAGWLRQYTADPRSDPFPDGCNEVVDEWRMKFNVVLRNVQASCQDVVSNTRTVERQRQVAVQAVRQRLRELLAWLQAPLAEEVTLARAASLSLDGRADEIDDIFAPLVEPSRGGTAADPRASDSSLDAVAGAVRVEGEWLVATVEKGLRESYRAYEQLLVVALTSVLRWFEQATTEVVETVRKVMNPVRQFYIHRFEARKDGEDALRRREAAYADLCTRLSKACSVSAAEDLFVEGLQQLEGVAAVYTSSQVQTLAELNSASRAIAESATAACEGLLRKLGLESLENTLARFEAIRQAKIEAALANTLREQQASAPGAGAAVPPGRRRGNKKEAGGSDSETSTSPSLPSPPQSQQPQDAALLLEVEDIPLEVVEYPQTTAADGTVFNLVGPMVIIDEEAAAKAAERLAAAAVVPHPPAPREGSQLRTKRSFRGRAEGSETEAPGTRVEATPTPEVPEAFVTTYEPMLAATVLSPSTSFLSIAEVSSWKELLREELLNWTVALRTSVAAAMEQYCAKARAETEKETNELLRRHRRRPAALQAEIFEARVRELESARDSFDKHTQRLRERLTKLTLAWSRFIGSPQLAEKEGELLAELEALEAQAPSAATLSALQSQGRHHEQLCTQYASGFSQQCAGAVGTVESAAAALREECDGLLADRARALAAEELGGGTTLAEALERDTTSAVVRVVLDELARTVSTVKSEADAAVGQRRATAAAARERYAGVYTRSLAELQLVARVQEAYSALRTKVHSFMMASKANEDAMEEAVRVLESILAEPVPRTALRADVHQRLLQESEAEPNPATAAGAPPAPFTPDVLHSIRAGLDGALQLQSTAGQREVRSCPLARALDSLRRLREPLYYRAVTLDALAYSVEMVQLVPEYLVEPPVLAAELMGATPSAPNAGPAGGGGETAAASNTAAARAGGGGGRRQRAASANSVSRQSAPKVVLQPLPKASSAAAQLSAWTARTQAVVAELVAAHVAVYPAPLLRALPGVGQSTTAATPAETSAVADSGDWMASVTRTVAAVCAVQEERLMAHVAEATRVLHGHVGRISDAVDSLPRLAAASLHALACSSMERRLGAVLAACGDFTSRSLAQREAHRRSVKASRCGAAGGAALASLAAAEAARQRLHEEGVQLFWALALREVQDEVDQHVARCHTAVVSLFQILRGLVLPERVVAFRVADISGHRHHGIRRLMRMRAQQAAEAAEERTGTGDSSGGQRERRLQEIALVAKQQGELQGQAAAQELARAGGGGGPVLPPASALHQPTLFGGLPLPRSKPLELFNQSHPSAAIAPVNAIYGYFPSIYEAEVAAKAAASAGGSQSASHTRRSLPAAKRRSAEGGSLSEGDGAHPTMPPIPALSTRLHRDTVGAVRGSVELLETEAEEVAQEVSGAFDSWEARERRWGEGWGAMMAQLQDSSRS